MQFKEKPRYRRGAAQSVLIFYRFLSNKDYSRDIYYSDPIYFGSQRVVDTLVDDIAYTIGVSRAALHVVCSRKGSVRLKI